MKAILTKLHADQLERLNALSKSTRVPRSIYIREAIEDLLKKYRTTRKPDGVKETA